MVLLMVVDDVYTFFGVRASHLNKGHANFPKIVSLLEVDDVYMLFQARANSSKKGTRYSLSAPVYLATLLRKSKFAIIRKS